MSLIELAAVISASSEAALHRRFSGPPAPKAATCGEGLPPGWSQREEGSAEKQARSVGRIADCRLLGAGRADGAALGSLHQRVPGGPGRR